MTPQELKNSILQLALQGKLTGQRFEDGTTMDVYQKMQDNLSKMSAKERKKEVFDEITIDEIPFEIPDSWMWFRLGNLCNIINGFTPLRSNDAFWSNPTIPWFTVDDIHTQGRRIRKTVQSINECALSANTERILPPYTVLICCTASVGEYAITEIPLTTNQQFNGLVIKNNFESLIDPEFLFEIAATFKKRLLDIAGKTTFNFISVKKLSNLLIPLPPIAEQKRIVAKIEELLPYIDRYEKAWSKLEAFNKRFPIDMQKSILQMAIQGKLVEQRPEEGTGEELYQKIQDEKHKLIKTGKIKKEKPLPEIPEDEIPFGIPESWKWVRWGELSQSIQYGYNAPAQQTGRIKMVRISDIQDGTVLWDTVPFCKIEENDIPTYMLEKNDILFARTGGTVGKSYLVKLVPEKAIYAGYLIRTRYSSLLCPEYMKYFMESQLYWNQLKNGTIATAQPNCNGKTLAKMFLPLPPLAEQKRIVEKLEKILPLCEKLR